MYHYGFGGGWLLGGLLMLLFWIVVIVLTFLIIRAVLHPGGATYQGPTAGPAVRNERALEILKERYARGEITREQYQEMRHDLEE